MLAVSPRRALDSPRLQVKAPVKSCKDGAVLSYPPPGPAHTDDDSTRRPIISLDGAEQDKKRDTDTDKV